MARDEFDYKPADRGEIRCFTRPQGSMTIDVWRDDHQPVLRILIERPNNFPASVQVPLELVRAAIARAGL